MIRELSEWRPDGGVVSVFVEIDPADRSEGWRVALKDELGGVPDGVAERILSHFPADRPHPSGRSHIGFLEVAGERDEWTSVQASIGPVKVAHDSGPCLTPLIRLLENGGPFGVVVVSLERVRAFEWLLGRIEELEGWELEVTSLDWRERKSPQRNPQAGGTGTTAAGRDRHADRLDHNRERFLKEAGELVAHRYGDRQWRRIVIVGLGDRPALLAAGLGPKAELVHIVAHDLIGEPASSIGDRVAEEVEHLNREREERLVERLGEAVGADPGVAIGQAEVLGALEMAQARHVVFDPDHEFAAVDGRAPTEEFVARALATGADVTPASGFAAEALSRFGGVAALLRFATETQP